VEHRETPGSSEPPDDTCAGYRTLVSASLDGETANADELALERHLAECSRCTQFRDASAALTRKVRVRSSAPESAFVSRVMADARPARLGRTGWPRPVLAWCALVIAVQGFAPLVLGHADGAPAHVARHVGASSIALACGLLYAAWRPHRAYGLLPFVGALTATTLVAAIVDTVGGSRSAFAESTHLAEVIGTVVLWIVAGSPGWDRVVSWIRPRRPGRGALRSTS
jgi:predicted anti-sigma-YlaC factor YlaD